MASIQTGSVFAKTIILGDHGTGRSSLIHNLDIYKTARAEDHRGQQYDQTSSSGSNHFFTAIELTSHELDSANTHQSHTSAILKLWEYTQNLSKKDEQLAFRGALFCIITFDICNIQSFKSVFEHWIPLKEQLSSDSFLYIVGTHLDRANYRQISLSDICKACAKKDAMYIEVSNTQGTNFPLLRKVLCKRVEFMLRQKEAFANRTNITSSIQPSTTASASGFVGSGNEEEKMSSTFPSSPEERNSLTSSLASSSNRNSATLNSSLSGNNNTDFQNQPELSLPFLEPHILSGSIGSIFASCFGLEEWEGYLKQEKELLAISERIDSFVTQLAKSAETSNIDIANIPINDDIFRSDNADKPLKYLHESNESMPQPLNPIPEISEEEANQDAQELAHAFKILGLNVPKSLMPKNMATGNGMNPNVNVGAQSPLPTEKLNIAGSETTQPLSLPMDNLNLNGTGNTNSSAPASSSPVRPQLRKLLVKLPTGGSAEMILNLEHNVEQQIDMFLLSYGLGHDQEARRKLLQNVIKIQRDYLEQRQRLAAAGATSGLASNNSMSNSGTPNK